MTVTDWVSQHRRSILFLIALGVVAGIVAGVTLPVALFPNVSFPRIRITVDAGDQPAQTMVTQVTRPIEQAVKLVPGVRDVRSTTSRGSAEFSLTFDWGSNMDVATLQAQSAVSGVLPSLPSGTNFDVRRMNPTVFPVAAYSLTATRTDQSALRDIAQFQLVPLLSSLDGVAYADVQGGDVREYRVEADPALLAGYGLTMDDLGKALGAGNVLKVVGRLEDRHKLLLVTANTQIHSLAEIANMVVRGGTGGVVSVKDVARVYAAPAPNFIRVTADGRAAVIIQVFQQPSGNTVQIMRDIRAALARFKPRLPADVSVHNWYDQSQLIESSALSVWEAIVIGVLLAGAVLYTFLRSRKITLVVLLVVPAVLAITVLVLSVAGLSFNIMTLGGMAAAIGLIIDDAIVMIEQIARTLTEGERGRGRIQLAQREFFRPLAGSSAATIIIFLPLAFLGGVTGAFFRALSLTMASALLVSFVVAWVAIPLLADRLITAEDAHSEHAERFNNRLARAYRRAQTALGGRAALGLGSALILIVLGGLAFTQIGSGFMPSMDEGGFVLDYVAPPGTSLTDTDGLLRQIEHILRETPDVLTYSRRTGTQLGGGLTEANTGDFFVRLKPFPRRDIDEVIEDVHHRVENQVPGLEVEIAQLMEDLIGDLTAVPEPIEIQMFGDDGRHLRSLAPKVAALISHVDGVTEIKDGVVLAGDGVDLGIDPYRAGIEGLTPDMVAQQVQAYLAGDVASSAQMGDRTIGIRLWTGHAERSTIESLSRLLIVAPDGHKVALRRIATPRLVTGEPELTRDNLKSMVAVTARIEGRDLGSAAAEVKRVLDRSNLFSGSSYYVLGGLYREQQHAFQDLAVVIAAAFLLVFVLLLFLYERFDLALSIIAMPLMAMPAVFIGLFLTGIELNISAMMGMTMVVGIVTEVAIFFGSEYMRLQSVGLAGAEALVEAGVNRLRPIAMTTLAAILALLPLALGLGQGAAMQQPLAVAIISGLIVQMPLVLLLMPQILGLMARRGIGGSAARPA